jgi:hypothetical protein
MFCIVDVSIVDVREVDLQIVDVTADYGGRRFMMNAAFSACGSGGGSRPDGAGRLSAGVDAENDMTLSGGYDAAHLSTGSSMWASGGNGAGFRGIA